MAQSLKVSISLPEELLAYAECYRQTHGLSSRSEVLAQALRVLREAELAEGYRELAVEYRERRDPLVDALGAEGLEPSDETTW
jgi:antitoxin ParD1/3/4